MPGLRDRGGSVRKQTSQRMPQCPLRRAMAAKQLPALHTSDLQASLLSNT